MTEAAEIIACLEELADEERAINEARYLKSPPDMRHIGVKVPLIRKVAKAFNRSHKEMGREQLLALTDELWSLNIHETRMAAIELLNDRSKLLVAEDAVLVERLIDDSHTWAYVDNLSAHTMGAMLKRFPDLHKTLDKWAVHVNFWLRRAAMLSLLIPLRNGEGDFERFSRYADSMLCEKEFFIRKAIGWVLRDMSKRRPELVNDWLVERAHRCSMLTVREASRHLPKGQADALIAAAKSGEPIAVS